LLSVPTRRSSDLFVSEQNVIEIGGSIYPSASLMFRNNCFDYSDLSRIPEISGDELLIYSLVQKGKIYFLNQKTCIYRRWAGGVFSAISKDREKLLAYKMKDIRGYRKFNELTGGKYSEFLKNKISRNSMFIVKHSRSISVRLRYLRYLKYRELVRLLTFRA